MDELAGTEKPARRRAHALQRARPGVQHPAAEVSLEREPRRLFGFKEYPYWEVPAEAKQAPKVNFGR